MTRTVTVAICTWNRAAALDRVLESMTRLMIPDGWTWELVIVNNNCTDSTDAVITRHAGTLPIRRLFEATPGISHARNRAVVETTSEIIVWIDDDAIPDPEWLAAHVAAFDAHHAMLVFGKVDPLWETGLAPRWYGPRLNGHFALLDYGPTARVITDPKEIGFNVNLGFRRELVDRIGAYRLDIGTGRRAGGEDQDLCQRTLAAGLTIVYDPRARVQHIIPASRCQKSFFRRYMWSGSVNHLKLLRDEAKSTPTLLGLPRYFVRLNLGYAGQWLWNLIRLRPQEAFYYELRVIRFVGLFWHRLAHTDPVSYDRRVGE
jgi:glycosyltransferase involved in cell wall biosynthesis